MIEIKKDIENFNSLSIEGLKNLIDSINSPDILKDLREYLLKDNRKSAATLLKRATQKIEYITNEKKRLFKMSVFERDLKEKGYKYICGIDEVGRGALAGPLVAAAVILPSTFFVFDLKDSKKLSRQKREKLYDIIVLNAVEFAWAKVTSKEIDELSDLTAANKLAMQRAVEALEIKPDFLLIDSLSLPEIPIEQISLKKGEDKSISIAAASIVAKVSRDRLMYEYDELYPQYGFYKNVGYGTKEHLAAIDYFGFSPIHRRTFHVEKIKSIKRSEDFNQFASYLKRVESKEELVELGKTIAKLKSLFSQEELNILRRIYYEMLAALNHD